MKHLKTYESNYRFTNEKKISIDGFKLTPSKIEFTICDDDIEEGDYFADIKKDGTPENFIHILMDDDIDTDTNDYFDTALGVDVIPLTFSEYEWNKEGTTYKKIELGNNSEII